MGREGNASWHSPGFRVGAESSPAPGIVWVSYNKLAFFMDKQIIVISGGTTFDTYENYISYLKNKEIRLEELKSSKSWKDTLAENLGNGFEVLLPRMPNRTNARYEEWKIWFERMIPFFSEHIILVGHSLGGIFLAKYLSENTIPRMITATILIAAPFDDENSEESLADFALPASFAKFVGQSKNIFLIHSKDDPVVPFDQMQKYQHALPNAKEIVFNNREHFNQEVFPEIVDLIKSL